MSFFMKFFDWQPLEPEVLNKMKLLPKSIAIFPHTTYWDIVTLSAYVLRHPELQNFFHVFVRRTVTSFPASYIFSNFFHAIPVASPKERRIEGTLGTIDKTAELFKNEDNFCILMSPEGSLKAKEWRSGYLNLALKLKVPIIIVGFDFVEHKMKFPGYLDIKDNTLELHDLDNNVTSEIRLDPKKSMKEQIQPHAEELMSRIYPLVPAKSWVTPKIPKGYLKPKATALGPKNYFWLVIIIVLAIFVLIIYLIIRKMNKNKER